MGKLQTEFNNSSGSQTDSRLSEPLTLRFTHNQKEGIEKLKSSGKFHSEASVVRECVRKALPELLIGVDEQ